MHAGLARARGEIVVTMDGDLQNEPEDIPRLVAAVESGADVASGRRVARKDSWGRTLPSRLINGMLRRFTGVAISDFGCAFNAYRRSVVEPVLPAIGKQKFTKALVLSGGASVVEVDVGTRRARGARATRRSACCGWRCTCSPASGRSRSSGSGSRSVTCTLLATALGIYGIWFWIDRSNFPGPLLGGVAVLFVLGIQGFILALVGSTWQNPARGRGPASLLDLGGTVSKRVLVTGGAGFISSNFIRHLLAHTDHQVVSLDALTYAGTWRTSPT